MQEYIVILRARQQIPCRQILCAKALRDFIFDYRFNTRFDKVKTVLIDLKAYIPLSNNRTCRQ